MERINLLIMALGLFLNSCTNANYKIPETEIEKVSYSLGVNVATTVKSQGIKEIDIDAMSKAFNDVFEKNDLDISEEEGLKILQEYLKLRKVNSKYDIDGIVIYNNQEYKIPKLRNPKYVFAFKMDFDEQKVNTEVLDVEYNASKDGLLIPRLLVKTVKIGNVNISKVTGHNGRFIINNKIGPGTIIELIRSGDVIPKVNNVIKSSYEAVMNKWLDK